MHLLSPGPGVPDSLSNSASGRCKIPLGEKHSLKIFPSHHLLTEFVSALNPSAVAQSYYLTK